jgi:cytochrome b
VLTYLREEILLRAPRHIGHNPAASAMILALLMLLAMSCITGYMMTTNTFWGVEWIEEVHETLAGILVALIVVHVLGVLLASFLHQENLILSMLTGRKRP